MVKGVRVFLTAVDEGGCKVALQNCRVESGCMNVMVRALQCSHSALKKLFVLLAYHGRERNSLSMLIHAARSSQKRF